MNDEVLLKRSRGVEVKMKSEKLAAVDNSRLSWYYLDVIIVTNSERREKLNLIVVSYHLYCLDSCKTQEHMTRTSYMHLQESISPLRYTHKKWFVTFTTVKFDNFQKKKSDFICINFAKNIDFE